MLCSGIVKQSHNMIQDRIILANGMITEISTKGQPERSAIVQALIQEQTKNLLHMVREDIVRQVKEDLQIDMTDVLEQNPLGYLDRDPIDRTDKSMILMNFNKNELLVYEKAVEECKKETGKDMFSISKEAYDVAGNRLPERYMSLHQTELGNSNLFWSKFIEVSDYFAEKAQVARTKIMDISGQYFSENTSEYMEITKNDYNEYVMVISKDDTPVAIFDCETEEIFVDDVLQKEMEYEDYEFDDKDIDCSLEE